MSSATVALYFVVVVHLFAFLFWLSYLAVVLLTWFRLPLKVMFSCVDWTLTILGWHLSNRSREDRFWIQRSATIQHIFTPSTRYIAGFRRTVPIFRRPGEPLRILYSGTWTEARQKQPDDGETRWENMADGQCKLRGIQPEVRRSARREYV